MRRFRRVWRLILEDVAVKTTDIGQEQKLTFLENLLEKSLVKWDWYKRDRKQ